MKNHIKNMLSQGIFQICDFCTKIKKEPYCAKSHDARHEKSNKQAQNMCARKDLDELDLAFTIVDDVYELRKRVFDEMKSKIGQKT